MSEAEWTDAVLDAVLEHSRERAGLTMGPGRRGMTVGALERFRERKGLPSAAALVERMADEDFAVEVMAALTIGETYFFREPAQFELLRTEIIPERRAAGGAQDGLHMWSVGCASGEEPYSLAILLDEEGLGEGASIFASDLSEPALLRARRAVFRPWSFRGMSDMVRDRYFDPVGNEFRLQDRLRDRVVFFPHNIAAADSRRLWLGLWGLDVVLCRNVLIYFTEAAQRTAYLRIAHALAPGGWLLVGASDPPPPPDLDFELVGTASGQVYRRRAGAPSSARPPSSPPKPVRNRRATSLVERAPTARDTASGRVAEVLDVARQDGTESALAAVDEAIAAAPLDVELRFVRAVLNLDVDRPRDADAALREVLYLDRTLPVAHYLAALVKEKLQDRQAALRSLANVDELLADRDDSEDLRLGGGETVRDLRAASARLGRHLRRGDAPS